MTFLTFDQGLRLIHSTVVRYDTGVLSHLFFVLFQIVGTLFDCNSAQSKLGVKQLEVGGNMVEVFGVERTVQTVHSPTKWHSYFLADG